MIYILWRDETDEARVLDLLSLMPLLVLSRICISLVSSPPPHCSSMAIISIFLICPNPPSSTIDSTRGVSCTNAAEAVICNKLQYSEQKSRAGQIPTYRHVGGLGLLGWDPLLTRRLFSSFLHTVEPSPLLPLLRRSPCIEVAFAHLVNSARDRACLRRMDLVLLQS